MKIIQEGHGTNIAQVVDRTINKFSTGGINNSLVRACADGSKVDKDNPEESVQDRIFRECP